MIVIFAIATLVTLRTMTGTGNEQVYLFLQTMSVSSHGWAVNSLILTLALAALGAVLLFGFKNVIGGILLYASIVTAYVAFGSWWVSLVSTGMAGSFSAQTGPTNIGFWVYLILLVAGGLS